MEREQDQAHQALGQELLRVYEQALRQHELGAAEHVLSAFEELARSDASFQPILDRAYLSTVDRLRVKL